MHALQSPPPAVFRHEQIDAYINTTLFGRTWMTGSCCGSGKCPLRPEHSMSNDRMRRGAMRDHSPEATHRHTVQHIQHINVMSCFCSVAGHQCHARKQHSSVLMVTVEAAVSWCHTSMGMCRHAGSAENHALLPHTFWCMADNLVPHTVRLNLTPAGTTWTTLRSGSSLPLTCKHTNCTTMQCNQPRICQQNNTANMEATAW